MIKGVFGVSLSKIGMKTRKDGQNLSFKSETLYKTNIVDLGTGSLVPARITRLSRSTEDDQCIKEIERKWNSTWFGGNITSDYQIPVNRSEFLALELDAPNIKQSDRTLGLAEVAKRSANVAEIEWLQSAPCAERSESRRYKGAGENLTAGIARYALNRGDESVVLNSAEDGFYEHIGFHPAPDIGEKYFALPKQEIPAFVSGVENKYRDIH